MTAAARALDDCWNRIGVRGDQTCGQLKAHIHCRNCDVYSAAARHLFDTPVSSEQMAQWTEHYAQPVVQSAPETDSVLIFRCGDEWLAVSTPLCVEVASHRTLHSLPHRRHAAVLGLANVRGELIVCLSLAALLATRDQTRRTDRDDAPARLVILAVPPTPVAIEVDEVFGTHRFASGELAKVSDTLTSDTARRMRGTLQWRERTVGVLAETALLDAITRSLA
jgi:chemotaxis-related protein WspD